MNYFTSNDHNAILASNLDTQSGEGMGRVHQRMMQLHRKLQTRFKTHDIPLYTCRTIPGGVCQESAASAFAEDVLTIRYMRSHTDATVVERMMGRDAVDLDGNIEPQRHPVIEIRVSPEHIAVELIIGPDAWHDQQNFIGKFTVQQHRNTFHKLLHNIKSKYLIGFWSGIYPLDDMFITTEQLPPARILSEFVNTFAAGRDYLRIGRWYEVEDPALSQDTIVDELFDRVRELYDLYDFALWTSNNNFHSFYKKAVARQR